jgi:hypothetical protein
MENRLNRPQSLAHRSLRPGNSVCAPWGRGLGKSWAQRFTWYDNVDKWDGVPRPSALRPMTGVRIVHLMPTFKACKDVHKDLTLSDLEGGGEWAWLDAKIDRTSWHIKFPGGSWIQWFGAREANSARGIRCDIVTVDEADDIDPSVIDSVVKPWFSEPWSLRMVLLGGTPRRGRYGLLYREHMAGLEGDKARLVDVSGMPLDAQRANRAMRRKFSFHATYRDAPETVDPQYVEEQRLGYELSGGLSIFKREWECDFDSAEGLVFAMFDARFHVREPAPGTVFSEVLVGADFGWEDPGVYLVAGVVGHGADAVIYLIDEVYQTHRDNSWWDAEARRLVQRWPTAKWYPDTSRPDRIADLKRLGARVQHFEKPQVEASVGVIADRLAIRHVGDDAGTRYAKMYVSPKCKNTIDEFGKYRRRRDPRNADRFLDDIEDKNNHACDSARYLTFGRFGNPPRTVHEIGPGWQ